MPTTRTPQERATSTREQTGRKIKYKQYLVGDTDSGEVYINDHLGNRIVIFASQGFEQVPFVEWMEQTRNTSIRSEKVRV